MYSWLHMKLVTIWEWTMTSMEDLEPQGLLEMDRGALELMESWTTHPQGIVGQPALFKIWMTISMLSGEDFALQQILQERYQTFLTS